MKKKIKDFLKNNKETKVIVVIGEYGKTSTVEILASYLRKINKKVLSISSIGVNLDSNNIRHSLQLIRSDEELYKFINIGIDSNADYIIVELHEESIWEYGVGLNFQFDMVILTNMVTSQDASEFEDMTECIGKILKNNNEKISVISNIFPAKGWRDWLKNLDIDLKTFSPISAQKEIYNRIGLPDLKPELEILYPDRFILSIAHENVISTDLIHSCPFFNFINLLEVILAVKELGVFNIEQYKEFIKDFPLIPGRGELISYNNKSIIIDLHGVEMISYINDWEYVDKEIYKDLINEYISDDEIIGIKKITLLHSINTGFEFGVEATLDAAEHTATVEANLINSAKPSNIILSDCNHGDSKIDYAREVFLSNLEIPCVYIKDRREAIKTALSNMSEGELLVISGRGDRSMNVDEKFENDPFRDIDIVSEWFEENL